MHLQHVANFLKRTMIRRRTIIRTKLRPHPCQNMFECTTYIKPMTMKRLSQTLVGNHLRMPCTSLVIPPNFGARRTIPLRLNLGDISEFLRQLQRKHITTQWMPRIVASFNWLLSSSLQGDTRQMYAYDVNMNVWHRQFYIQNHKTLTAKK